MQKMDNISFDALRGFEKAAILLNCLGTQPSKMIFKHIEDHDIRRLLGVMSKFRIVPVEVTKKILEEYYEMVSEAHDYIFSEKTHSKDAIVDAVGEERARGILGHLSTHSPVSRTLESLELVDSKSLSNFLLNEHPQTISVILAHLEPEKQVEVLKCLPGAMQAEIVLRFSNLDHVSPELIAEVDRVLKQELSATGTVERSTLGGIQPVVEMLNVMDKSTETSIMSRIEEKDPILAEEIRRLMFVFEDIVKIDDKGIQTLLKKVDNSKLLLALKTASDEFKNKIFNNISRRAIVLMKEDLENMGPTRLVDVEAAQAEIVSIARRLESEGKILIMSYGSEEVLV